MKLDGMLETKRRSVMMPVSMLWNSRRVWSPTIWPEDGEGGGDGLKRKTQNKKKRERCLTLTQKGWFKDKITFVHIRWMVTHLHADTIRSYWTHNTTQNVSSSMNQVDVGKYLLLHHRQPLACRLCHDAPRALYAIHYHWAFVRHTGSPVPCLRTMVIHKVKDILSPKPNPCFPTSHCEMIGQRLLGAQWLERSLKCVVLHQFSHIWETKVWFSHSKAWNTVRDLYCS